IYPEGNSVFTSDDVQRLAENDIELENDEARYSSAVLDAYKAMTLAGEKLFITFTGEKENASEYIADIAKHFGAELINVDNLDALYMSESVKSAEKQYVINSAQLTDGQKKAVEAVLSENEKEPSSIDRIKAVMSNNSGNSDIHRISDIAPIVFPQTALSPTAIEKLNGCKFAYFLRYGMNLSSSAGIAMNASNYGNIMHYIMKYCFEKLYDGARENGNPHVSDGRIKDLIEQALADYRKKYLLTEENMSARFNTLYNALSVTAFYLIKYMAQELEKSRFVPSYFELKLESGKSENGFDISPYSFDIELADKSRQTITVGGTVDRVDIAYDDDKSGGQIRVIDYKTGNKDAKLSRIYYGLDLQLLLYLFTLAKNNRANGFTPSAALYHPSGKTSLKDIKAPSDELKRGIWLDEHKEKGFAVEGTQQEAERLYTAA
ncbi:MAG: PD-(D/E)XK nuclease family protein, partial [[Eubacterium] siraeum]